MKNISYPAWAIFACILFFQNTALASIAEHPVTVPIGLSGNSILINASVNGVHGHFIVDTGSPGLILNNKYFRGIPHLTERTEIVDFHGGHSSATYLAVNDFTIGEMKMKKELALVTKISQLEKIKGVAIHGIIGHSSLEHFELLFDFGEKTITLFPLARKGRAIGQLMVEVPSAVLDLKMSGHLPFLTTILGGKKVRLGIDTGSEVNVFHEIFFNKNDIRISNAKEIKTTGLSGELSTAQHGELAGLEIGQHFEENIGITLTNLHPLNQSLPTRIHGLLGIEYLKGVRFSINYQKKKLCIWSDDLDDLEINNTETLELEAQAGGKDN